MKKILFLLCIAITTMACNTNAQKNTISKNKIGPPIYQNVAVNVITVTPTSIDTPTKLSVDVKYVDTTGVKKDSILAIKVASANAKVDSLKRYLQNAKKRKIPNEQIYRDVKVISYLEFKPKMTYIKPYDHKSLKHQLHMQNYRISQTKYYIKVIDRRHANVKYAKGWITRALE